MTMGMGQGAERDANMGPAERLGATLGVLVRFGAPAVREATSALAKGTATSAQQKICALLLDAVTADV